MSEVRRRIIAAVGTVIGVAVAAAVVVVIKAETAEARHETPAATEMPIVVEAAACLGKMLTRKTATDGGPSTAEMAPAKAAAHASAAAEAAHASAAAEPAAHMSATGETAAVSSRPSGQVRLSWKCSNAVHNFRTASTTEAAKALGFQYAGKGQPLQINAP
jgi:hypothetical protein